MRIRLAQLGVLLSAFFSISASAATLYVSLNSTNPVPPYADWSIAATNIQDAVDASTNGDLILVTNGVYATGGRVTQGLITNRVVVDKPVKLLSFNGPTVTIIVGYSNIVGIRCAYLTNGAELMGFMLSNGVTGPRGARFEDTIGGGVWCQSSSEVVSNCILANNKAGQSGGGAYNGTLLNCVLTNNSAVGGGGAASSILSNCILAVNVAVLSGQGGGALGSTLNNCILFGNSAALGGGAWSSVLNNCLVVSNTAYDHYQGSRGSSLGGGVDACTANNCTIIFNTAVQPFGTESVYYGGGAAESTLNNCIVQFNSEYPSNYVGNLNDYNYYLGTTTNCCTSPLPNSGVGNFSSDPLLVNPSDGDFHLQSNSPCINSGNNAYVSNTTDLDGNPRIVGGTVDIGAYEFQTPVSQISYAWLQQFGLSINTNTDSADPDGDGLNNYQEWIAGTIPTNALSALTMLPPVPTNNPAGLVVGWESVSNRTYFLQSSTNLGAQPAFSTIQSNIIGQAGTTGYMDTNAVGNGPYFYRVGVQP